MCMSMEMLVSSTVLRLTSPEEPLGTQETTNHPSPTMVRSSPSTLKSNRDVVVLGLKDEGDERTSSRVGGPTFVSPKTRVYIFTQWKDP